MTKILPLALLLALGCSSFGPGNLQSRHSTDLQNRKIRRIAILPPALTPLEQNSQGPLAPNSSTDKATAEREAPEILARLLYSTMASMPNWQIVSESEVQEITESVQTSNETAKLKQIGKKI